MMINRKDTPAPSTRRAEPPTPLALRPAAQGNVNGSAPQPPQTPRNKIRTKRASKVHRTAPHETYMESNDAARAAADEHVPKGRISHDLNLTDNGRHSVVDNMLMSLNPDQGTGFISPTKDRPPFSLGSESTAPPTSAHRHLHSSSLNSEFSFPSDDTTSRAPRGRRSNSSTNNQSALSRIDSVYVEGEAANSTQLSIYQVERTGIPEARPPRSGRKSNKSSISSSVDLGQGTGQSRFTQSHKRRSASFDDGRRVRVLHSASSSGAPPPPSINLTQPLIYDDSEAAPTPTVPAGPRKHPSTVFPPPSVHSASSGRISQRRDSNSLKTSKSYTQPKKKGELGWCYESPMPSNPKARTSRRSSRQVTIQHMPTFLRSRNPSPQRHYSEPLMAHRVEAPVVEREAVKDRPGFFRRVFGSSKGATPIQGDLRAPSLPQPRTASGTRANSREGYAAPLGMTQPPPSEDASHPPPEAAQPSLVKKPSSFFRRRKKSVSENIPSPMLPPNLQARQPVSSDPHQSTTSSLLPVMNPYLDDPMRSDARQFAGTAGYEMNSLHTRTLRAKGSADTNLTDTRQDAGFNNPLRQPRDLPSPRREKPAERSYLRVNDRISSKPQDNSFFHDDSSNETRILGAADENNLAYSDNVRPDMPPTSVPSEMRPRKENANPRSRDGWDYPAQRPLDSPKSRNVLSTLNGNVPASPRPSITTGVKSEPRDWLTHSQVTTTTTTTTQQPPPNLRSRNVDRVWLQPGRLDDEAKDRDMSFPADNHDVSPVSDYQSASSILGPLSKRAKEEIHFPEPTVEDAVNKLSVEIDPTLPSDIEQEQAKQVYDGDETLVTKSMAAAWLGEPFPERVRIRQAYMELFDWQNLNILAALRDLCGRLYLKGEAQQVDRILDAFSTRWCACNPNHGFKASDVVHTICYSVLLLNTDLHQAEIETKMTRQQFLKNILPTVRRVVTDAAPNAFTNTRASTLPPFKAGGDPARASPKTSTFHEAPEPRRSYEGQRPLYQLSQRPSDQTVYSSTAPHTPLDYNSSLGETGPLVKTPFHGKLSTWENQVEIILKDFFNSIRQQSLPLHGTETKDPALEIPQTSNSLSAMTSNMLRRTPSVLSKAGSDNISYSRGRVADNRLGTGRWQSKNRSRPRLYPSSTVASSRRSSIDEQSSVTSPSVMSAWSKFSSLGKTQTSLSIDSLASNFPHGDYQQSIGFANALSQAIIREEGTAVEEETLRVAPLLEDESLELAGAPWAKEGILKHKHHLESVEKKAKDRNWVESFAVIEKGYMRLFSFSMNAKSLRQKTKNQKAPGGVVGGGNWADSAETLGTFLLRHTIASALPPPGYSKTRPHVWALSLPTGAVHLFHVGTPEIVKEFVTTANYWSARLSKEPMVGGISNIEYGWGETVINPALLNTERNMSTSAVTSSGARPSLQSSIRSARSSIDQGAIRARLPGDRVVISDWTPPQQTMVASVLMEVDQFRALSTYVKNITDELEKHNELRTAMLLAFSTRHPNSTKAMTNWERKSSYLLREIVKFRTYIDCLQSAQAQKEKVYVERRKAKEGQGEYTHTEGEQVTTP